MEVDYISYVSQAKQNTVAPELFRLGIIILRRLGVNIRYTEIKPVVKGRIGE